MNIIAKNGDGLEIVLDPLIEAMVRVLVNSQTEICANREGCVRLHFVTATGKVHGKLEKHVGLERFQE